MLTRRSARARLRTAPVRAAVVLLFALACSGGEPEPVSRGSDRPAEASLSPAPPAQDTTPPPPPFQGTTAAIDKPGAAPPVYVLRAVRVGAQAGFDRVVFEFAGDTTPGYRVEYADPPARECGSGNEVSVMGGALLIVRLRPAKAHDDRGNVTIAERARAPALPAVKEMKLICDFEAQVEWALGVAGRTPYRVLELRGPPRLVLDLRHAP